MVTAQSQFLYACLQVVQLTASEYCASEVVLQATCSSDRLKFRVKFKALLSYQVVRSGPVNLLGFEGTA